MSNNPFAAFQAQQSQAQNPVAFGGQIPQQPQPQANPFGAQAPQASPQSGFGAPPATAAPAALAGPAPMADAGGFGYGMPDLSDVSESGGRLPNIPEGTHLLVFTANKILTRKGHSVIIDYTIETTDNPAFPAGSVVSFFQKISRDPDKRGTGLGKVLSAVRATLGFADEASFKANPAWNQIFTAIMAGQAAPWQGRKVWCRGIRGNPIIDDKTHQPTGAYWPVYQWAPFAG